MFLKCLEAGLLNKSSISAAALGVAKFITISGKDIVILFVLIKSYLDVPKTEVGLLKKSSSSAAAFGVTQFR